MTRKPLIFFIIATLMVGTLAIMFGTRAGSAQDVDDARNGNRVPIRAVSYIEPDPGLPTFNPNVPLKSECPSPTQRDPQVLSPAGTTRNNVHNDACLFKKNDRFDGLASFQIVGVGTFSACPDPDRSGPKTAAIKDGGKRCFMTGYQETGDAIEGDEEYHSRINNTTTPGQTNVRFCDDPQDNGCDDARVIDRIRIDWVR